MLESKSSSTGIGSSSSSDYQYVRENLTITQAAKADLDTFGKKYPTVDALVGKLDGKIIAIGGFAWIHNKWFVFLDLMPESRKYKVLLHKTVIDFLKKAKDKGIKYVYADVDPDEPGARRWLKRLGFQPVDMEDGRFYKWRV